MATVKVSQVTVTNTPDEIIVVAQTRPAEALEVRTDKRVTYWYHGPFLTEGPWDASGMESAKVAFERYREAGWWERKTEVITTVTERLRE